MLSASKRRYGDSMNPLLMTILTRVIAGAATAATVPSFMNGEPSLPVPASMEEAVIQAVSALIVVGSMYLKSRKDKKK